MIVQAFAQAKPRSTRHLATQRVSREPGLPGTEQALANTFKRRERMR
jgi:hypothetical protein